ncbi:MAG: ferredoxin [Deltaproteobacteria bacterium]|nr:ferredoxin [Deltaproteobacteria bacterium]
MEPAQVNAALCDGCGRCAEVCCVEAIELIDGKAAIGPDCILCMACAAVCRQEAITLPELPRRAAPKPRARRPRFGRWTP